MSNILNSEDFGLKIYNRFPPKYREDDVEQKYALKRYIQALSDGGFKYSIDEINGITDLIDPYKVDAKVLPVLFKQYGLEVFNGIPEEYLRYLLPKLGEAWSKKGSLSVVEFITSSLSGIKTTTEVRYDDGGNPIVDVRLEMDYNIGDYFPEAEQLNRLLSNFVPFYCDTNLIYSYLFYETQVLRTRDIDLMNVTDTKREIGCIPYTQGSRFYPQTGFESKVLNDTFILNEPLEVDYDPDYHEDNIITHILESSSITRSRSTEYYSKTINQKILNSSFILNGFVETDEFLDNIKVSLINEQLQFNGFEDLKEHLEVTYNESVSIRRRGIQTSITTSLLGESVLGEMVLADYEDNADVCEDHIVENIVDYGSLTQPIDTLTNRGYNTLNGRFYTNAVYSYDIVTVNGKSEVVFSV